MSFSEQPFRHFLARLCCSLVLAIPLLAGAAEPFVWDARVERGELANGLRYYIQPTRATSATPPADARVAMQLLVRVGSLDERADQSGVAHMVEHMVFHASQRYPEGLRQHMESLGWRVGSHYNAQTNFERTLYMLSPEARPERLEAALDVLAEIAGHARIPAAGLDAERQIILEEWRTKLGVRERMERQRRELLRAGSLYPERPTIGSEASIRSQPAEALRAFYGDWYRPGNMALIVVGEVDPAALRAAIEARFASLEAAPLPPRNPADPRLQEGLRIARMQDAESGSSQVGWLNRFAGADKRQDSEGLRQRIVDRIAERSMRRLVKRQADALPAGVESLGISKGELGASVESLGFASNVGIDGHRAGLRQILLAQERVRRDGLDPADIAAEIEEVRRLNEKGPAQQAARDASTWLQLLSEAVQDGRVLQDPQQKQAQIRAILAALSPAEVDARARRWLAAGDRLLFMMAPGLSRLTLPTAAEVLAEQAAIAREALPALPVKQDKPAPAAQLPEVSSAGRIVAEQDLGHGVLSWTLANGDRVVWQALPGEEKLRFVAQSRAGRRLPGAPSWQWQMAAQLGAGADLAAQQEGELARWQAAHGLRLESDQDERRFVWSATLPPASLESLLQLYAARQTRTLLSAGALKAASEQLLRQNARRTDSVGERQAREMSLLRFGDTPLDGLPDETSLRALQSEAGLRMVQERWQRLVAQPVSYFIAGDLDAARVRELVEAHLAGLPRTAAPQASQALLQAPGHRERTLAISPEPQASLNAIGSQPMHWSPERAIATAVLQRVIHRRLRTELREKESGIYRLRFELSLDPRSGRLASTLFFTAAPERLDALWGAARRVLERLPQQLDAAALSEEIARMRKEEGARRDDAATRFQRLQLSLEQYGDARYLDTSAGLAASLTVESLRALAAEMALTRDMAVLRTLPRAPAGSDAR